MSGGCRCMSDACYSNHQAKKEAKSDLKARGAALKVECGICKAPMINYHQLKQHYDSKHPKETCPPDPNAS